ncbi:MAG: DUF2189 domain-containing protein [Xanthobacteraceae bacterium]|nr:DUF2189 domain-containing protein [Xanthobacteraceae bacterium]
MSVSQPDTVIYVAPYRPYEATPIVRRLSLSDLAESLKLGWDDFKAMPTHAIMLALIYPVIGLVIARLTLGYSILPLLFPLASGFALLGPFAAIGLYELSRRREIGETPRASDALRVLSSPSLGAMLGLGLLLMVLFMVWIATAQAIYISTFGYEPAASMPDFIGAVLTTWKGWLLIATGCGVGLLFAFLALLVSVVSFPLLLDRHGTMPQAMLTSMKAVAKNPAVMTAWGLIVAGLLLLGSLPFFVGLAVVIPVVGHATWHLYRKTVEPIPNPYQPEPQPPKAKRFAADFPASLFAWISGG